MRRRASIVLLTLAGWGNSIASSRAGYIEIFKIRLFFVIVLAIFPFSFVIGILFLLGFFSFLSSLFGSKQGIVLSDR